MQGADRTKIYILVMYYIIVGILAAYAFSPISGNVGIILTQLTPHLLYIPLVMTALWYPHKRMAHFAIFIIIFVMLCAGYFGRGRFGIDSLYMIFITMIYIWVYVAILKLLPRNQRDQKVIDELERVKAELEAANAKAVSAEKQEVPDTAVSAPEPAAASEVPVPDVKHVPVHVPAYVPVKKRSVEIQPEQIAALINSFAVRDSEVSSSAVLSLVSIGDAAVPYLIKGLKSEQLSIRETCARTLGCMKSESAVPYLIEGMDDSSKRMQNASLQALANIGPSVFPDLEKALSHESYRVRAGACAVFRIIGYKEKAPLLLPLTHDASHYVRKEAAKSLGRLGCREAADSLCYLLDDESGSVRLIAAASLGRIRVPETVPRIMAAYKNESDKNVRDRIVRSLAAAATEEAMAGLRYISVFDSDDDIRYSAKDYLFGLGGKW